MNTFDVTLPDSQPIVFPPLCVVCEKENPDGHIKLSFLGAKAEPLLQMAVDNVIYDGTMDGRYYGGNTLNKIDGIPACKGCSASLKRYHFFLKCGYYTGWLPGMGLIFLHVPIFISMVVVVGGAMSAGIYTMVRPPSFGATFYGGVASFEFKSRKVAEAFMHLNYEGIEKVKAAKAEEERLKAEAAEAEKVKAEAAKAEAAKAEAAKSQETAPQ